MAGIKQPIQDILTKLASIQAKNQDGQIVGLYSRIWNNQVDRIKDGEGYAWPRPAAFVEFIGPVNFDVIGLGLRSADIGIKIHLIHDCYNNEGTMDQDMIIFDLRDQVLMALSEYCPTACSSLYCTSETQDMDHGNLYHYILDFICNFTDSKGSPYDPDAGKFNDTPNPNLDQRTDPMIHSFDADPDPEFIITTNKI